MKSLWLTSSGAFAINSLGHQEHALNIFGGKEKDNFLDDNKKRVTISKYVVANWASL